MAKFVYSKPLFPGGQTPKNGKAKPGMLPFCCSSCLILLPVDQLNHRYDNPYSQSPSTTANLFLFQPPLLPIQWIKTGR